MIAPEPVPRPLGPDPAAQLASARRAARTAQWVAVAAVTIATIAVVVSLAALANTRGNNTGSAVAATSPGSDTAPAQTTEMTATTTTASRTGATRSTLVNTGDVRPEAQFKLRYEKQPLRVAPLRGCEHRYVDLDEPRVGVSSTTAEFGYGGPCGGGPKPELDITDDVAVSTADSNSIARDCAEAIRNGPVNEPLVPTEQTSLCLLGSAKAAEDEGNPRRLFLVKIDSIAADGTLSLLVTAWDVPA